MSEVLEREEANELMAFAHKKLLRVLRELAEMGLEVNSVGVDWAALKGGFPPVTVGGYAVNLSLTAKHRRTGTELSTGGHVSGYTFSNKELNHE